MQLMKVAGILLFMTLIIELSREEVVNVSGDDPVRPSDLNRRVKFEAFNRSYDLTLQPSQGLLSPHFSLMVRRGTGNETLQLGTNPFLLSKCFYRGSDAAFDLCQGMVRINSYLTFKYYETYFIF